MAIEALFNESYTKLLERARIESANETQTLALVEMSVSDVRIGFYKSLGKDRIDQIIAIPLAENPSTDDEILRASAANLEALWLTYILLPRLPTMFMSSSHTTTQAWNEEPLTRDSSALKEHMELLKVQLDQGLSELLVDETEYVSQDVRADSIGADVQYDLKDNYPAFGVFNR